MSGLHHLYFEGVDAPEPVAYLAFGCVHGRRHYYDELTLLGNSVCDRGCQTTSGSGSKVGALPVTCRLPDLSRRSDPFCACHGRAATDTLHA